MKKALHWLLTLLFAGFLIVFGVTHILLPDGKLSRTERRSLAQVPKFTVTTVADGVFMQNLETYLPDQFPLREGFRSVKAVFERMTGRLDTSEIYAVDGYLASLTFGYSDARIEKSAAKLTKLRKIFTDCPHAVLAVIPPKNVYMDNGVHPVPDFDGLIRTLTAHLSGYEVLPLDGALSLESYYRTDSHWRQEMLAPVVEMLCAAMEVPTPGMPEEIRQMEDFYGVYAGQSALPVKPDTLTYLTSPLIESVTVTAVGEEFDSVYTPDEIGLDFYDIFLGGAVPVAEIVNPGASGELIVVRDSFGSSLIPLLIPCFGKITAVDLRYISSSLLGQYVNTDGADLLVLLSAGVLDNSEMLRIE